MRMSDTVKRLLVENYAVFQNCYNGIGSQVGWFNRLISRYIPEKILGVSLKRPVRLHDAEYKYPEQFNTLDEAEAHKAKVDKYFWENCAFEIEQDHQKDWLDDARLRVCAGYYWGLKFFGRRAFLSGKTIGGAVYP